MTGRYTISDLLGASARARALIDPRVARAVRRLSQDGLITEMPRDTVLAAACLGDPLSAVRRLAEVGILPDELPDEQREELALHLSLARSELNRRSVLANAARVAVFLGLPEAHRDTAVPLPTTATPAYRLFPHQRRAVARARSLLQKGRTRLLLHMPTGAGKTRTTMSMVCDFLREHEGRPVLWLASTRELLEQAAREFHRAWTALGNREVPITTAWSGQEWDPRHPQDGLLVASLQTVYSRQAEPGILRDLGRRLGLIIFDEAHQAIAPTYQQVVQHLSMSGQPITPIVGLSATPGRTFIGAPTDEELAEFFEHTKIELEPPENSETRNPVSYLISQGYLADPEFRLLGELPTTEEQPIVSSDDIVQIGINEDNYLNEVISATLDLINEAHRRIIVFAASVELVHTIAAALRAAGIPADGVDGTTSPDSRDTAIRQYKGDAAGPRVLVNYGVLTTGFDAPQTSAVVVARPTRSLVLYSQMAGRGIRGPKSGGNKNAVIATVVDPSVPEFGSMAAAFTHWEDMW